MKTKVCARCRRRRRRDKFYSAKNRPDGLYNYCKDCVSEINRAEYPRKRARKLAYQAEYSKRPDVAHRIKEYNKRVYAETRDKQLAAAKAWARNNRAKRRRYIRAWNKKNRNKVRQYRAKYKALKRNASEATFTVAAWRLLLATFDYRCAYCGKKKRRLEQDHVVPLSRGGAHAIGNIVPACRSCNAKKHYNRPPTFWWLKDKLNVAA
jgi:5-methylcytosine-specific restriction endonuclease McrA